MCGPGRATVPRVSVRTSSRVGTCSAPVRSNRTVRLRPGRRGPDSGVRLGGPAPLGLQICQRDASTAPRRHQAAQRQRADDRVGKKTKAEAIAAGRRPDLVGNAGHASRLPHRGEADRQDQRRDRLGMAPLGPPGPGPRRSKPNYGNVPPTPSSSTSTSVPARARSPP